MEIFSFSSIFLIMLLVVTFCLSMINPKILKMNSRMTALKIHGYMFLTSFIALIVSIALDDRLPIKSVEKVVVDSNSKQSSDTPLADTERKQLDSDYSEIKNDTSDVKVKTRQLKHNELVGRLNGVFELNNIPLELEQFDDKEHEKTIDYNFETDDEKLSCTITVVKENSKVANMLCFVKHNLGDKENEKIVEGVIDSVGQAVFAIVDRNDIKGVLPRFDYGDIILTRGVEEFGNLLKVSHLYFSGQVESSIVILLVSSPEFDSERRRIPLNFVVLTEPRQN